MNEHDRQLAERLHAIASREEPVSLAGYMVIQYDGEEWPIDDGGINALPEDVVYGTREATDEEKLAALKEQGYTLND